MKNIFEIKKSAVVSIASALIQIANKKLSTTMDLAEELLNPLPSAYHKLIQKRSKDGLRITRIGFGSPHNFIKVRGRITGNRNLIFRYISDTRKYKRMLLVDDKALLFSTQVGKIRRFFFSTDQKVITVYKKYFSITLKDSKSSVKLH